MNWSDRYYVPSKLNYHRSSLQLEQNKRWIHAWIDEN